MSTINKAVGNIKNDYWLEMRNIDLSIDKEIIFSNLNLDLSLNENTIFIGPNGSGKSTIFNLINRSNYPLVKDGSSIKIFNKENINIWELRQKISFVNNEIEYRIYPNLLVKEVVLSGLKGKYNLRKNDLITSIDLEKSNNILKIFDLLKIKNKKYKNLSQGLKRKVLIARAIVNNPMIIALDEPLANLDFKSKKLILDAIKNIQKNGTTLLQVSHTIESVSEYTTTIILLKEGKILKKGAPKDILTSKNISELFDMPIRVFKNHNFWQLVYD
tara:strand:+ start:375 stop:1193 length:819 start_codon:yes stop_codon:yes gene_type:complete